MNERIKELASQAGLYDFVLIALGIDEELEKFSELIIRECMAQCVKVEDNDELSNYEGGFRDGALLCYQEIKEHFGIDV